MTLFRMNYSNAGVIAQAPFLTAVDASQLMDKHVDRGDRSIPLNHVCFIIHPFMSEPHEISQFSPLDPTRCLA